MDLDINKLNFLTTYNKDYKKREPIKRTPIMFARQEFEDPISEGQKHYLTLGSGDIVPPNENAEEYLKKCKENYKDLARKHLQEPINNDVIIRNKITKEMVTEYQTNYCDIEKDIRYRSEQRKKKLGLPDNAKIPLTTYTSFHREKTDYLECKGTKPLIVIPPETFELTTGKFCTDLPSDYSRYIGKLGGFIVKNLYEKHQRSTKKEET